MHYSSLHLVSHDDLWGEHEEHILPSKREVQLEETIAEMKRSREIQKEKVCLFFEENKVLIYLKKGTVETDFFAGSPKKKHRKLVNI